MITKKDFDDDDSDDEIHLWPEYLARGPSISRSTPPTEPSQQGTTSLSAPTFYAAPSSNRNNQQRHRGKFGCVEPVDHRDDHLHRVCPGRSHSLLIASNSNREFLAHAVFLDDSSSPTEPPCSSVLQVCALWDAGSNTCLITPNTVKPHWHWVSRKTQNVAGVGGKITQSIGIAIVPLKLVHSGAVRLVCCTVIDFHKVIVILFGLDFQFTHSCVFDPSNFRV